MKREGLGGPAPEPRTPEEQLRRLAQDAIHVQNASNLAGVLHSMHAVCTQLRGVMFAMGKGQAEADRHPIMQLWVDKVASLSGIQSLGDDRVMDAYKAVKELAQ